MTETLAEYANNPLIASLPPILSTVEALQKLEDLPDFSPAERRYPAHLRAHCIMRLADCFFPLSRHVLLEQKFALALRRGYKTRNPLSGDFTRQLDDGAERIRVGHIHGVEPRVRRSGTSFTVVGCSGIGKSTAIERILELQGPRVIPHTAPVTFKQIVWVKLECPYQGSMRQLCIDFFDEIDGLLGIRGKPESYKTRHTKQKVGVDELQTVMAQVARAHALGVLIIDEIQKLIKAPGLGKDDFLNFLLTLVNKIGIPVIVIGTPIAVDMFQSRLRDSRRSEGMGSVLWDRFAMVRKPGGGFRRDPDWDHFVETLWKYQWLTEPSPPSEDINEALYDETQGITDLVVKLFMLCQLHALHMGSLGRPEVISPKLVRQVAADNFGIVRPLIAALRSNDPDEMRKYEDLEPLHYRVRESMEAMLKEMGVPTPPVRNSRPETPPTSGIDVVDMLCNLGFNRDIAIIEVERAKAANPDCADYELVGEICVALRLATRKPVKEAPARPKRALREDSSDLRVIAAERGDGVSIHGALAGAGLIDSVEDLIGA